MKQRLRIRERKAFRQFDILKGNKQVGYLRYDSEARLGEYYNPKLLEKLNRNVAGIGVIFVDKKHRWEGIGSTLIKKAEHQARADGKKSIILEVAVRRKSAQKFYKKHGFDFMKRGTYTVKKRKYVTMVKELK
jgi:GNAT superfamily N-acetyltransferase